MRRRKDGTLAPRLRDYKVGGRWVYEPSISRAAQRDRKRRRKQRQRTRRAQR